MYGWLWSLDGWIGYNNKQALIQRLHAGSPEQADARERQTNRRQARGLPPAAAATPQLSPAACRPSRRRGWLFFNFTASLPRAAR